MSKGLEELKILKFLVANCSHFEFDLANIEKELKDFEELIEKYKVLRITKDEQYYALSTISDIIRDFNKGEFASAEIALQEITSILKEVLL